MYHKFTNIVTVHPDNFDPYNIYIGSDIYSRLSSLLKEHGVNKQIAVISVPPVSKLYMSRVCTALDSYWQVITRDVRDGEQSKYIEVAQNLYTWLIENRFERNSTIIALGGGVVGDLAGFVASTYLRGTNLVHLPTSLLAQVDSSIGGKVGINHPLGKNLIGAFYQPKFVLIDISVLSSLDNSEYICGLGEVIKYGILSGNRFFQLLEDHIEHIIERKPDIQDRIIQHCVKYKVKIVTRDPFEKSVRSSLNLGHTFGHALETFFSYRELKHGQAVMLGILCSVYASRLKQNIESNAEQRITNLIKKMPISLPDKLDDKKIDRLLDIIQHDKKIAGGKINIIGIEKIGTVQKIEVDNEILKKAFYKLNEYAS